MKTKKIFALLLSLMLVISSIAAFAEPEGSDSDNAAKSSIVMDSNIEKAPDIKYAESAILMDMKSGRLLYAKNAQEKLYPASTTKMMTGILALENGNMEDKVTATY